VGLARRVDAVGHAAVLYGSLVYDPVRDAVVLSTFYGATWTFSDAGWTVLDPTTTDPGFLPSLTYDPRRRAVIGVLPTKTAILPSDAARWTVIEAGPNTSFVRTIAVSSSTGDLVASVPPAMMRFTGDAWTETLAPPQAQNVSLVADLRRGTITSLGGGTVVWERVGQSWLAREPAPLALFGFGAYAADTGEILFVGGFDTPDTQVLLRSRYTGDSPLETCTDGLDDDGDGLVGCDDPDCWWACTPACPPHASCP
jgi:hypothetical protein